MEQAGIPGMPYICLENTNRVGLPERVQHHPGHQ